MMKYNNLCIWKYMSLQKESTTFKDVDRSKNHELLRCKYSCYGYGQYMEKGLILDCDYYKPLYRVMVKYSER